MLSKNHGIFSKISNNKYGNSYVFAYYQNTRVFLIHSPLSTLLFTPSAHRVLKSHYKLGTFRAQFAQLFNNQLQNNELHSSQRASNETIFNYAQITRHNYGCRRDRVAAAAWPEKQLEINTQSRIKKKQLLGVFNNSTCKADNNNSNNAKYVKSHANDLNNYSA